MAAQRNTPKRSPEPEAATSETLAPESTEPETTTDYTRRAGGYVLTERGWIIPEGGAES